MLKSKTLDRIACAALALMLALTAVIWAGKANSGPQRAVAVGYEGLFDQSLVHAIDIEMADWDGFIATATQEEYVECAVTIDGERLSNVAIRAKGNTSLSSVASMGSEKYSFKIEFDHFVKGRQYKGLDKLSLNNLIYDATMMKDYLAYTLMGKMDVPSPLCSFVQVTVNGELWGLYLAVEGVEDGFLERNRMTRGELYKPDSMSFGGGRGNGRDFDADEFQNNLRNLFENRDGQEKDENSANAGGNADNGFAASFGGSAGRQANQTAPEATPTPTEAPAANQNGASGGFPAQGGNGNFAGSGGGAAGMNQAPAAQQTAQPTNAPAQQGFGLSEGIPLPEGVTIPEGFTLPEGANFPNPGEGGGNFGGFGMGSSDVKLQYIDDDPASYGNIFNNAKTDITKKDQTRLIESLRKLSAGEDLEDTVFTDEVIRYLAVHSFLCNDDSYTGMIVHNYYLYEENGQLAIIPWDYNLAFGGQSMGGSGASGQINSPIDSPVANGNASDRPLVGWIFSDEAYVAQYHEIYDQFVTEIIESGWLEEEIARVAAMIRPLVEADPHSFFTVDAFDKAVDTMQAFCALRGQSIRGQLDGAVPSTTEGQRSSTALVDASSVDISAMGSMGGGRGGFGGFGEFNASSDFSVSPGETEGTQTQTEGGQAGGSFGGSAGSRGESANTNGTQTAPDTDNGAVVSPTEGPNDNENAAAPDSANDGAAAAPERDASRVQRTGGNGSFPGGFIPPDAQEAAAHHMSWTELGIWAAALLLAVLLVLRVPGHQR